MPLNRDSHCRSFIEVNLVNLSQFRVSSHATVETCDFRDIFYNNLPRFAENRTKNTKHIIQQLRP